MGGVPVIDMHMHLFPRFGGNMQSRQYGKVQLQDGSLFQAMPPSFVNTDSSPEVALAYMDWCGVDKALLLQGGLHGPQNSFYLNVVKRWPDRFVAFVMVDPTEGDTAARPLRELLDQGLLGLKLELIELRKAHPEFSFLGQEEMKVWEVCAEKNAPIAVHLSQDERSLQEAAHIRQLLQCWPNLSFMVCHIGFPPFEHWKQRALLGLHPNVYLDTAAFYWYFNEIRGQTYPFPGGLEALKWVVDAVGTDKLLWGSDYPMTLTLTTYAQMLDLIRQEATFLSEEQKAQVLGGNAAKLLAKWQAART